MQLLEEDERFLTGKGIAWEASPNGAGLCIIVKDFPVDAAKYDRERVDLMVCIPAGYNNAKLDNFYVDPPLRMRGSGQIPPQAEVTENHAGRSWQRFSRHFKAWRAGIDTLSSFWPHIAKELQQP
jgi:hypothetical protein